MNRTDRLTLAALVLVAARFVCIASFHQPALSGPDASGYFTQAKALATSGQTYLEPTSPLQFVGPHWLDGGDGRYFAKYPPGFPLLLAVPYALSGPTASLWVDPLLVSGALLGLFLLCRLWLGPGWGLVATALMATNPLVNQHAVAGFSHTAVAFLLVWGIYALARWTRDDSWPWLALAGLCVGAIPTARYAEVLYVGAFALYVALHLRHTARNWRAALPGAAAAALPMAWLALRNQLAFGAFWRTAYAISGEQTGFGLQYFAAHWAIYLETLGGSGVGLLFGLGVIGVAVLVTQRQTRTRAILLAALILPTTLLYMAYYFGGDNMSQRFLLPTYYLYVVGGVWLLKILGDAVGRPAVAVAVVLALSLPWGLSRSLDTLSHRAQVDSHLVALTDSLAGYVPDGAIVLADRTVGQHLDVLSLWRVGHAEVLLNGGQLRRGPGAQMRTGGGAVAVPDGSQRGRVAGSDQRGDRPNPMAGGGEERWSKYRELSDGKRARKVLADLRQWAGSEGRAFVLVPGEDHLESLREELEAHVVARFDLPTAEIDGKPGGDARSVPAGRRPGRMMPGMARGFAPPGRAPFRAMPTGSLVLIEISL